MTLYQAQTRATGLNHSAMSRRSVIDERRTKLRAVSSKGIREDIACIIFSLIVITAVCMLLADLTALQAGSFATGKLSSEINMLEDSNSLLMERLALSSDYPFIHVNPDAENMVRIENIPTVTISIPDLPLSLITASSGTGP